MRFVARLSGFCLLIFSVYLLGRNIFFTTNPYPYWWRGIAADASILLLTGGILGLFFLPRGTRDLGWISIGIGTVLVFFSSRAVLNPTSLWEFFLSFAVMAVGYRLLSTGRLPF